MQSRLSSSVLHCQYVTLTTPNKQVCLPSTPANYFHLLRRQIRRDFRKPLIVISPKSLLRLPACQSDLSLFYEKDFQRLLPDELTDAVPDDKVKRIIMCSGRVYYDIFNERKKRDVKDVVIVRVEQICPFPYDMVGDVVKKYTNAEVYWVQEEPFNQVYCSVLQCAVLCCCL